MDVKPGICQACCSHDRQLHSLEEVRPHILKTNISQLRLVDGEVCWECKSLIQKFTKFLTRVEKAQESIFLGNQICMSSLSTTTNRGFDAEYYCDLSDPLNVVESEMKDLDIKVEDDFIGDEIKELHSGEESDFDEPLAIVRRNKSDIKTEASLEDKPEKDPDISDDPVFKLTDKIKSEIQKNNKTYKATDSIQKLSTDDKSTKYVNKVYTKLYELVNISEKEIKHRMENKRNNPTYKRQPFKCDSCVLGFRVEKLFLRHMEKHDETSGDHRCNICSLRFDSRPLLAIHKDKHSSFFKCRYCQFETASVKYVVYHIKEKHGEYEQDTIYCIKCGVICELSCDECLEIFETSKEMRKHYLCKHKRKKFYCKRCHKLPKRLHRSQKKVGVKRRKNLTSDNSQIFLDNKEHLEPSPSLTHSDERLMPNDFNHIDTHSNSEERSYSEERSLSQKQKFTCNECGLSFKLKAALIGHSRFKHKENSDSKDNSNVKHLCQECGKIFSLEKYLRGHILFVHRRESKFKCETCNKIFFRGCKLKIHMQIHHGLERPRNCICDACGKAFYNTTDLTNHMLVHSDERRYKCSQCGAAFKQTGSLSHHMKWKHKGVVANSCHICQECGKSFGHERWLNDHIEFVHRKQSKYKCESCDKIFSRHWNLLMHNQTNHSIDRPRNFGCEVCGKKFYRNEDMKKHMLIHSEERKYKCKECGATFKQTGSLCNHIKSKHKGLKFKAGQTFKFE